MKNKHKIVLVKTIIALSGFFVILASILGVTSELKLYGNLNEKVNDIALILIAIGFVFTSIMIVLIFKIDIRPEKTKPRRYRISIDNFSGLRDIIRNELLKDNYEEFKLYKTEHYKIEFAIKNSFKNQYVVAMLKMDELSEKVYNDFKKNYFDDFDKHLIDNGYVYSKNAISIFYVICVTKKNKFFTKYINQNVYQFHKRYNLPIGIDLEKGYIYIATQKEGLAPHKYYKLKRMFKKYISRIIEK